MVKECNRREGGLSRIPSRDGVEGERLFHSIGLTYLFNLCGLDDVVGFATLIPKPMLWRSAFR